MTLLTSLVLGLIAKDQRTKRLFLYVARKGIINVGSKQPAHRTSELTPIMNGSGRPVASLVIPSRNEAGNIGELITRLEGALTGIDAEIIFVDDSSDGTPEVISGVLGIPYQFA